MIYVFGFIFPFLFNNISVHYTEIDEIGRINPLALWQNIIRIILYIVALITNIYFSYLEYIDFKFCGFSEYFKTYKNVFDFI